LKEKPENLMLSCLSSEFIKMNAQTVSAGMESEVRAVAEIDLLGEEEDEEMELGILQYLDRLEVVTEAFFSRQVHI
jgi:hypothetical protein